MPNDTDLPVPMELDASEYLAYEHNYNRGTPEVRAIRERMHQRMANRRNGNVTEASPGFIPVALVPPPPTSELSASGASSASTSGIRAYVPYHAASDAPELDQLFSTATMPPLEEERDPRTQSSASTSGIRAYVPYHAASDEDPELDEIFSTATMPPLEEERNPRTQVRDNTVENGMDYVLDGEIPVPVFEEVVHHANGNIIRDFRNAHEMQGVWSIGHIEMIQAQVMEQRIDAMASRLSQLNPGVNGGFWQDMFPAITHQLMNPGAPPRAANNGN